MIAKDDFIIKEWKKFLASQGVTLDTVDVSPGLATVLAIKDEDALVSKYRFDPLNGNSPSAISIRTRSEWRPKSRGR